MDVILGILLAVLLTLVFMTAVAALIIALSIRRLVRRNKVTPDAAVAPPVSWLAHPSAPARLHRRLRNAVAAARASVAAAPSAPRLADLATEMEQEAIALDHQLVAIARLPTSERKARLAPLVTGVGRIEHIASQISLHAAQSQAPLLTEGQPSALDDLATQLDLMEEARLEVARIEGEAGLRRPSPYEGSVSPQGQTQAHAGPQASA